MSRRRHMTMGHYEQVDGIAHYIRVSIRNKMRTKALTAPMLAKKFRIEEGILKKIFKARFGMNIQAYVRGERIQFLREFLLQPKPVKVIAIELGYKRSSYLTVDFIRLAGIGPRAYRRSISL